MADEATENISKFYLTANFTLSDFFNTRELDITECCNSTWQKMPHHRTLPILEFAKIMYGIVFCVGLCGNTLVIYVVLRFSNMLTVTNTYLVNLALADEFFLTSIPFLIATMIIGNWPFGRVLCKMYMTTTTINQFASSLLLLVMSADRYLAVCHPISSIRYRTPFIAKFICIIAWIISALLSVPIYMYSNVYEHGTVLLCTVVWPESASMNGQKAYVLYSFLFIFVIPLVLIMLFYFLVIYKLRTAGSKNLSKVKKRSHRKVTYLVLTVITVYIVCWLPLWIATVCMTFSPPGQGLGQVLQIIILFVGILSYANSAINPILYAFLSDNFKKSFAKAFHCAAKKKVIV